MQRERQVSDSEEEWEHERIKTEINNWGKRKRNAGRERQRSEQMDSYSH